MNISWCSFETPDGLWRIAASEQGACKLVLPGEDAAGFFRWLGRCFPGERLVDDPEALRSIVSQLLEYLGANRREFAVSLHLVGTQFRRAVWQEIQRVPFGSTVTYGEIGRRLGRPETARAISSSVAANPVPILIPSHRVVSADGNSRSYGTGVVLAERLREMERRASAPS